MPISSMTGFARLQVRVNEQLAYTLSLKSVNHRFLDVQMRIPSGLDALEVELRKALKDNLVRGHVDVTLSVERTAQTKSGYNRELVAAYLAAFEEARREHGLEGEPDLNMALRLPGALQGESRGDEELEALAESVRVEIGPLLGELRTMREREGESLAAILHETLDRLAEAAKGVAELRPEVEQRYQERLTQRLTAAVGAEFNRQRLLVGKKLDFLLQEMNREANTLLSKTGGAGGKGTRITELGLAMKAEIEKAREQIQNLE